MCVCLFLQTVFTVADGAQSVVVLHALTDDPPLGEHRVGADGAPVEGAPGPKQVVGADVTFFLVYPVPVGDGEVIVIGQLPYLVLELQ